MQWRHDKPLILASKSRARQILLHEAGLSFSVVPSALNERALVGGSGPLSAPQQAMILAQAKAQAVSRDHPEQWVIGSDQILSCADDVLHQVADRFGALAQLQKLTGQWHQLHSAVCLVIGGEIKAQWLDRADLKMKLLTEQDLGFYLDQVGETVFGSVGCYHIEAEGKALFERIEGQRSTIMGMPVELLLDQMREWGLVAQ